MEALRLNMHQSVLPKKETTPVDFLEFSSICLEKYKRENVKSCYQNAVRHFKNYQLHTDHRFVTDELDKETLDDFAEFLQVTESLKNSTTIGILQRVKHIVKKAQQIGLSVDLSYEDSRVKVQDCFAITLDKRDIARLYYFTGLTKAEEEIRDIFILGCQTGQRFSDYSRLKKEHIQGEYLKLRTQKTKVLVCIPIDKYVLEIFAKYNYELPEPPTIQHFNKAIKQICRKAGLTSKVAYEVVENHKVKMMEKDLCDLVGSHTARRTYITQKIREGKSLSAIMRVTGHLSLNSLSRYDKTLLEENAKIVSITTI